MSFLYFNYIHWITTCKNIFETILTLDQARYRHDFSSNYHVMIIGKPMIGSSLTPRSSARFPIFILQKALIESTYHHGYPGPPQSRPYCRAYRHI